MKKQKTGGERERWNNGYFQATTNPFSYPKQARKAVINGKIGSKSLAVNIEREILLHAVSNTWYFKLGKGWTWKGE